MIDLAVASQVEMRIVRGRRNRGNKRIDVGAIELQIIVEITDRFGDL